MNASWKFSVRLFLAVSLYIFGFSLAAGAQNSSSQLLEPAMAGEFIVSEENIWPRFDLDVCWRTPGIAGTVDAGLVRSAVQEQIEGNSPYRFQGWSTCGPFSAARIEISIADVQPHTDKPGYQLEGTSGDVHEVATLMTLNFSFNHWAQNTQCSANKPQCIKTISVHEFLHALGALHEMVQSSLATQDPKCYAIYKDEINAELTGVTAIPLTTYDPDSIMNYCHDIYDGATHLSDKDKIGLNTLAAMTQKKMAGGQ
jgi:hypothetical protein